MPVQYNRTSWYGFSYLLSLKGSLLVPVLPSMLYAGLLSSLTSYGYIDMLLYAGNTTSPPSMEESRFLSLLRDTDTYVLQLCTPSPTKRVASAAALP